MEEFTVRILFNVRCTTWRAGGLTIDTVLQLHSYIDLQPLPCSLNFQARVAYTTVDGQNIVTQSVVGIATRKGLEGPGERIPVGGGGEIFRTRPDRPWGPPNLLYSGYRDFPGFKTVGAWG